MHNDDPHSRLLHFVMEREAIRLRREAGEPWPWTQDKILQTYRFCSVRREHDKVTRWIAEHWREPNRGDPDLWFAMTVARFVNRPEALDQIGWPVSWDKQNFLAVARQRKRDHLRIFNSAYTIVGGGDTRSKEEYVADVMSNLWVARKTLRPRSGDTLNSYHMVLGMRRGLGSFLAAQVVADLKYVEPLGHASDWHTFAASGPGSRRGLNLVLDRPMNAPWREDEWRLELGRLREWLNKELRWDEPLHAQDTQNCCCEFSKYEKTRLGEGRPKRRFSPG